MGLSRHLSGYDLGVSNMENTKSMKVIFFSKYWKSILDFENAKENRQKVFSV